MTNIYRVIDYILIVIVRYLLIRINKIEILSELAEASYKDLKLLRLRLLISSKLSNSLILKL